MHHWPHIRQAHINWTHLLGVPLLVVLGHLLHNTIGCQIVDGQEGVETNRHTYVRHAYWVHPCHVCLGALGTLVRCVVT